MVGLVSEVYQHHLKIVRKAKKTWRKLRKSSLRRRRRQAKASETGDSMLCCGRKKDQGRDIPPNAEPAASPRRLQLGQLASTLPPGAGGAGRGGGRELPPMVLQPDFRKVSGISTEIFRQLESVENDHDATTAAALGAVERRGEMLVRMLDPRHFSRPVQDTVRRFISMQDGLHTVHFVEIVKRPGQTLGLYIREGNGLDRYDGVFISRIAIESAVFNSGCLGVGDEILAVNLVDVTHMSLDDVVILMSIPRRLVLTIRQRKGRIVSHGTQPILRPESKHPPVVVIKKEIEEENYDESNDENGHHMLGQMGHGPHSYGHAPGHHTLSHGYPGIGRGRTPTGSQVVHSASQSGRLFGAGGGPHPHAQPTQQRSGTLTPHQQQLLHHQQPASIQSLPRHVSYQPYANVQMQHLPDVTDYSSRISSRHEDFRLEAPQPPIRRTQYDYYDPRGEPPQRPSSQQSGYPSYDWYRGGGDEHAPTASISYQPPPPVITEQPRSSIMPTHFQPFDRAYPKTLESLAEKVHTFYTGPRPLRQHGLHGPSRIRMPRTGSDHRISITTRGGEQQQQWYGSMPRQRTADYRSQSLQPQARYSAGLSARLSAMPTRRKAPLDYASDSEAMMYTPSMRSAGLSLPASTRRSLGLSNGRSNSLPRDLIRGRGGRKHNVRFDKRGVPSDLSSSMAGRRALMLASGMDSQDESDGAVSAPEMPLTPRRERGRIPSSPSVFTSAEYRAWLTRAPSTSAIYERLKTNRDLELLQTQRAAKFTFSAENLSLLDRARHRTERQIKILTENLERENQSNLTQWEAQQSQQEQPYYSYRSHLMGLPGGDSTLARALAGRSPSTSSALAALGIRDPSATPASSSIKESLSSDHLRRLGLTPSRSRDLISSFTAASGGGVGGGGGGVGGGSDRGGDTGGRSTPSASLLHRISAEKDENLLRKEILSRSLIGRDLLSRESLKEELEDKSEKIAARLSAVTGGSGVGVSPTSGLISSRHHGTSSRDGSTTGSSGTGDSRLKLLTINPSEFLRYKIERPSSATSDLGNGGSGHSGAIGHSGILRVHLLAGRALRSTVRNTDQSVRTRDLYCVLECDRVHKARTVVCTGDQNFDWDEIFELDLVNNKELDFLIYSWDPQLRHRLCYKGSVNLIQVLSENPGAMFHQLAIKVEPRGTLYVKLKHTPPQEAFKRELKPTGLFGADLAQIVMREDSGLNVPLIVQRCIEEIERRGLDIIGLYRLCGSATKKQTLREAFERNPRGVDLSAENVPDINVIAGVLKDYLRELPEPLLTKCLYQMLVDALGVCLPDDPEGNARLLFSIIECLPKPNRCTLLLILEHLSLVCSLSDRNKMGPTQLAQCFGPILMVHYDLNPESLDFQPPIKVLQYLLEVWPAKSVPLLQTVRAAGAEAVRKGPSLLGKGRPFPRSSPASVLLSRSQRTQPKNSLLLSPSKQSPGSLSESSPSPTSIHSKTSIIQPLSHQQQQSHHQQQQQQFQQQQLPSSLSHHHQQQPSHLLSSSSGTAAHSVGQQPSSATTTTTTSSSSSGALTLTPSTTSSSLTSVTTPNSLTPVSSTAKSLTPATTSSNYSLTSEFSTTSVTSPTPTTGGGRQIAEQQLSSAEDLFAIVSVRSRVSAFEISTDPPTTKNSENNQQQFPPLQQQQQPPTTMPMTVQQQQQPTVPPSPFPGRKFAPGHAERSDSFEDDRSSNSSSSSKRRLPQLPQSFQHPDMMMMSSQMTSQSVSKPISINSQQYSADIMYASSSSASSSMAAPHTSANSMMSSSGIGMSEDPSSGSSSSAQFYKTQQQHHQMMHQMQQGIMSSEFSDLGDDEITSPPSGQYHQQPPPPYTSSQQSQSQQSPFISSMIMKTGSSPPPTNGASGSFSEGGSANTVAKPVNVPPPPPPKPGSGMRQRIPSDEEYSSSPPEESHSRPRSNGTGNNSNGHHSNNHNNNGHNGSTSSWSSGGSSSTTPTTTQSQVVGGGVNSKGSSPGPATPGSTPPPVPPRLDRRPSQPSPTSSPPSMPPPVPPRLGRAAPVRTPSLDGREAFEVDCYTIKEENGEEDFLT